MLLQAVPIVGLKNARLYSMAVGVQLMLTVPWHFAADAKMTLFIDFVAVVLPLDYLNDRANRPIPKA